MTTTAPTLESLAKLAFDYACTASSISTPGELDDLRARALVQMGSEDRKIQLVAECLDRSMQLMQDFYTDWNNGVDRDKCQILRRVSVAWDKEALALAESYFGADFADLVETLNRGGHNS